MIKFQAELLSKIGLIYITATSRGVNGVFWQKQNLDFINLNSAKNYQAKILNRAKSQLLEYFDGKRQNFDLPLDIIGTEFQRQVWSKLLDINYGHTKSYKQLALELRNGNACRAVGNANSKNPLSIIIPCHRVIASDGTLGGYAGGVHIKTQLIDLEKIYMR